MQNEVLALCLAAEPQDQRLTGHIRRNGSLCTVCKVIQQDLKIIVTLMQLFLARSGSCSTFTCLVPLHHTQVRYIWAATFFFNATGWSRNSWRKRRSGREGSPRRARPNWTHRTPGAKRWSRPSRTPGEWKPPGELKIFTVNKHNPPR